MNNISSFICFIIGFANTCTSQSIELDRVVDEISNQKCVYYEYIDNGMNTSEHYLNFNKLKSIATTSELLDLTKSKNNVVACYAAWALCDRNYEKIHDIFVEFLNNRAEVTVAKSCEYSTEFISSVIYLRLYHQPFHLNENRYDSIFYTYELSILDSIILYNNNTEDILIYMVLSDVIPNHKDYIRIKFLALEKNNEDALVALSKYKYEEDVNEIIANRNILIAIPENPHPEYWKYLLLHKENFNNSQYEIIQFYSAIASFKNESALDFLNMALNNDVNPNFIHYAVSDHYDNIYLDLLINLWIENKIIDLKTLKIMQIKYPNKCKSIIEAGLLKGGPYEFKDSSGVYNYTQELILPEMLNYLNLTRSDRLIEIVNLNLLTNKFTDLDAICIFLRAKKYKESIPYIFQKMKMRPSSFDMYALVKTLLEYNNVNYNKTMKNILLSSNHWDEGNWSHVFRELLDEHDVNID